jgi:hypothetical protein
VSSTLGADREQRGTRSRSGGPKTIAEDKEEATTPADGEKVAELDDPLPAGSTLRFGRQLAGIALVPPPFVGVGPGPRGHDRSFNHANPSQAVPSVPSADRDTRRVREVHPRTQAILVPILLGWGVTLVAGSVLWGLGGLFNWWWYPDFHASRELNFIIVLTATLPAGMALFLPFGLLLRMSAWMPFTSGPNHRPRHAPVAKP